MDAATALASTDQPIDRRVDERVNDIVGHLNVLHGRLVDCVVELLADERLWAGEGLHSIEHWLRWRAGVAPSTASALADIARRADDLPESFAAFRRGELTLDQMVSIARRAPSWTDVECRDYAIVMTVPQLRRVLAAYPFPQFAEDGREIWPQPAPADPQSETSPATDGPDTPDVAPDVPPVAPSVEESCTIHATEGGGYRLFAVLDGDTGRIVESALNQAHDRLFRAGQHDVTWADALREVAESSLGTVTQPSRRARFKVAMFLETTDAGSEMHDAARRRIPDNLRRHLTCDGTVTPIFTEQGRPVSVGRAQHIVPPRTRTVIEHRDGGCCRVPGCGATLGLEVHHIIHWEHDGPTDTWNLVLICKRHHRMHHRGRLGITGNADLPDGLDFRNEHGRPILATGAAPNPPTGPPPDPDAPYRHPDGGRLEMRWVIFNPPTARRRIG